MLGFKHARCDPLCLYGSNPCQPRLRLAIGTSSSRHSHAGTPTLRISASRSFLSFKTSVCFHSFGKILSLSLSICADLGGTFGPAHYSQGRARQRREGLRARQEVTGRARQLEEQRRARSEHLEDRVPSAHMSPSPCQQRGGPRSQGRPWLRAESPPHRSWATITQSSPGTTTPRSASPPISTSSFPDQPLLSAPTRVAPPPRISLRERPQDVRGAVRQQ